MNRPTKERITEIQSETRTRPPDSLFTRDEYEELLAEIDALNVDLNNMVEVIRKCDQLKERVAELEVELKMTTEAMLMNGKLCDRLRESNHQFILDRDHNLEFYSKQFVSERVRLKARVAILRRQLELTGNACGLAKTFLMFHGKPSQQLDNCAEIMEKHEEMAFECLSIDEADIILNSKEPT